MPPLAMKYAMPWWILFDMRWSNVAPELSSDDLVEFQRICLPDSPDFILNLPDYNSLFTYTMFWGKTADLAAAYLEVEAPPHPGD